MTPDSGNYGWSGNTMLQGGSIPLRDSPYVHETFTTYAENEVEEFRTPARYGYYNNRLGAFLATIIGFSLNLEDWSGGQVSAGIGNLSMASAFPAETVELMKGMILGELTRYSALPVTVDGAQAIGNANAVASPGSGTVRDTIPSNRFLADMMEAIQGETPSDVPRRIGEPIQWLGKRSFGLCIPQWV